MFYTYRSILFPQQLYGAGTVLNRHFTDEKTDA